MNAQARLPAGQQLRYAAHDVGAMRALLVTRFGFARENVRTLVDSEATGASIRDALSRFADRRSIQEGDQIVIYFSGHGATVKTSDGRETGFLIPSDADLDLSDTENAGPYLSTCIPMKAVWEYLEMSPARHILV